MDNHLLKIRFEINLTGWKMLILLACGFIALDPLYLGSEQLMMTSYYPASGVYNILRARQYLDVGRKSDAINNDAYLRIGLTWEGVNNLYGIDSRHGPLTLRSISDSAYAADVTFLVDNENYSPGSVTTLLSEVTLGTDTTYIGNMCKFVPYSGAPPTGGKDRATGACGGGDYWAVMGVATNEGIMVDPSPMPLSGKLLCCRLKYL